MRKGFFLILGSFLNLAAPVLPSSQEMVLPVIVAALPNPNDFGLFADGGWDGNWYVGYNNCWIVHLPPASAGSYSKAYLGAKLGRAKHRQKQGRPSWEREALPGEIWIAISSTPAWNKGFLLAKSQDIPWEPDPENALLEAGDSQWFWAEVPLGSVNFQKPNFLALWSPTPEFSDVAQAPILAAGWGKEGVPAHSWLNKEIQGQAPQNASKSLNTALSVFEPSLAIKLIPANQNKVQVLLRPLSGSAGETMVFAASVSGQNIERAWLEISEGKKWKKQGLSLWNAPYIFTVKAGDMKTGEIKIRVGACDILENVGYSEPLNLKVQASTPSK